MPSPARCTNFREGRPAAAKREAGQMRPCTPTRSAPSATGRQYRPRRRPKRARRPGKIGACTDTPTHVARGGPLHRSAPKRFFLFHRARRILFLGKTKRGPRRAPRGGERRSKGAGAVFAARRKRRQADFATTRAQHRQRCISAPLQARDLQLVPGLRQFCGQFFGSRQAGEGHKERLDFLAR